jgi:hypothetical protein
MKKGARNLFQEVHPEIELLRRKKVPGTFLGTSILNHRRARDKARLKNRA